MQSLKGVGHVAVFVNLPIELANIPVDQVDACLRNDFPNLRVLVSIDDVVFGCYFVRRGDECLFDNVLYFLIGRFCDSVTNIISECGMKQE